MSGDNLHGEQPDIRYNVNVQHHEEWKLEDLIKDIPNWESEYLTMDVSLSSREKELLKGDAIKSHEGMMYGRMYADWKIRKGYE